MNQVNLMNLLYAVPEVAAVKLPGAQPTSQAKTGGMDFLLNLKQEIWAAQMPQFGVGLLTAQTDGQAVVDANGLIAGLAENQQQEGGSLLQTAEAAKFAAFNAQAQATATSGVEASIGEPVALLDVLTASLKQAVEMISSQQASEVQVDTSVGEARANAANPAVMPIPTVSELPALLKQEAEAVLAEQEMQAMEQRLFGTRHAGGVDSTTQEATAVAGKDAAMQSPQLALADTWRIAAGILKSELQQQGVVAEMSAPQLQVAQVVTEKSPWGLVFSEPGEGTEQAGKGITNPGVQTPVQQGQPVVITQPKAVMPGPLVTAQVEPQQADVSQAAPASIRWFAQPTGSTTQVDAPSSSSATQTVIAPQAMFTEVILADETRLKVTVTPVEQPGMVNAATKGDAVVLQLNLALAGEANVALNAKLTLLPVVQRSVMPQVAGTPGAEVAQQQVELSADGKPRLEVPEHPSQVNSASKPGGLEMNGNGLSRLVMPQQAEQFAGEASRTERNIPVLQHSQEVALSNKQMQQVEVANTSEPASKIAPVIVPPKAGRTGGVNSEHAESSKQANDVAPERRAALVDAFNAAQERKAQLAEFGQKPTSRLQALQQLQSSSGNTSAASELQPGLIPQASFATQEMPAQLMQFSSTALEQKPSSGMNYLELANRLMDKVADAKAAGNGVHSAKLTLNPANLGQMFVNISVKGESVALQVAVAAGVPKGLLKESLDALRVSLEESGLTVLEFRVDELGSDHEGSGNHQQTEDTHSGNHTPVDSPVEPVEAFWIDPELFGTAVPA